MQPQSVSTSTIVSLQGSKWYIRDDTSCASNSVGPRYAFSDPIIARKERRFALEYPETKRQRTGSLFERRDTLRLAMPADVMAALEELTRADPALQNQGPQKRDNNAPTNGSECVPQPAISSVRAMQGVDSSSRSSHVTRADKHHAHAARTASVLPSHDETNDLCELADFGELGDFDEETNRLLDVIWPECVARSISNGEHDLAVSEEGKPDSGGSPQNAGAAEAGVSEGNLLERQGSSTGTISVSLDGHETELQGCASDSYTVDEVADRQAEKHVPRISHSDTPLEAMPSFICAPIDPNQTELIERAVRGSSPGAAVAVPLIQPKLQPAGSIPDTAAFSQMVMEFAKAMKAPGVPATAAIASFPPVSSSLLLRQLQELEALGGNNQYVERNQRFGGSPDVDSDATSRRFLSTSQASQKKPPPLPVSAVMACDSLGLLGERSTGELLRLVEESIRANEFAIQQIQRGMSWSG